ncbi:probable glycosyltransferase At5g25310 [Quercus suber]|uniref:probable glycosyltransferase At5g25310 n=1 Tax=Quercus suber TaxID=58331 RepID=UPI0032DF4E02
MGRGTISAVNTSKAIYCSPAEAEADAALLVVSSAALLVYKYVHFKGDAKIITDCINDSMILSNYYHLPFNDIVGWHNFAVVLKEHDVYRLKQILKDIADAEFVALHKNSVKVRHFQWNSPPIRYDAFHMVKYELWFHRHIGR